MTLIDFLLARIAEDEAQALRRREEWNTNGGVLDLALTLSPARVLGECEAKRTIVKEHGANRFRVDPCDAHDPSGHTIPCETLRALAAIYAEHPDYREEWRA